MPRLAFLVLFSLAIASTCVAQKSKQEKAAAKSSAAGDEKVSPRTKALYGIASFYADKFHGRLTANGQIFSQQKMTAACNRLPLGTWIRVTNLRNKRSVIVQVNDRLHPKNPRLVDMSKIAAQKLGYIGRGLTQVKVEVLVRKSAP